MPTGTEPDEVHEIAVAWDLPPNLRNCIAWVRRSARKRGPRQSLRVALGHLDNEIARFDLRNEPGAPPVGGERVDHPAHYGGADSPHEAIKVIERWGLGFCTGSAIKYISRAGKKGDRIEDLKKARWYLNREVGRRGATQ